MRKRTSSNTPVALICLFLLLCCCVQPAHSRPEVTYGFLGAQTQLLYGAGSQGLGQPWSSQVGSDTMLPHPKYAQELGKTKETQASDQGVAGLIGGGGAVSYPQGDNHVRAMDTSQMEGGDSVDFAMEGYKPGGPCFGPGSCDGLGPNAFEQTMQLDGWPPITDKYRLQRPQPGKLDVKDNFMARVLANEYAEMFKQTPNNEKDAGHQILEGAGKNSFVNDLAGAPLSQFNNAQSAMHGATEAVSEAMADAFNPTWEQMLNLASDNLINVANEASGSACSASQPIKTHNNAVYLVQQAYQHVYLPIAILLLLPGAVATQVKGLVQNGMLNNANDEDGVSPFAGILRAMIAIFLIPATQLIVSYSIDVGNSLQYEVVRHVNLGNIYQYGDEQVFRAPDQSFRGEIMRLVGLPSAGKLTGGSEDEAQLYNQGTATVMLQSLANSMAESAALGLVMLCAFQITMACYLLLMGPVAAAFYAWPSGTGSLFQRIFTNWVDGIINLALWRFWWCVVLLVMDTRLGWVGNSMTELWELIMFISFLIILCYVPFNPFDFKPGEMVSQIMQKSQQAVDEATQKKGG